MSDATATFSSGPPVTRRSLADGVRDQIEARIRAGGMPPGAQLPAEESLCRQFQVSRTSVREAIRDLVTLGLVERKGNRACVVEHVPDVRLDDARRADRIREVFETRRLIEVQLSAYAAQRATPSQREQLVALADRIASVTTVEELRPLDRAFHGLIAAAAGNALLAELHTKVLDAVFASPAYDPMLRGTDDDAETRLILATAVRAHAAIAGAIAATDPAAAAAAACAHLDDVEQRVTPRLVARSD